MNGAARQVEAVGQGGASREWIRRAIVALFVAGATVGCSSSAPPPPPVKPQAPPAAAPASSPPAGTDAPAADDKLAEAAAPAGETAAVPETGQVAAQDAVGTNEDAATDNHSVEDAGLLERFAVLTPGGPLIVDVSITVDGKSLADAAAAAAAREDAGGAAATEGSEGASEGAPDEGDGDTSDGERVARFFRIRSSRSYSPDPRRTSLLWPLLDADGNGLLDEREIAAADRLWSRDADDDRVIRPAEVASLREQLDGSAATAMGRRSASGAAASRLAALPLGPDCNLDRVDFVFQDLYAPQQDLSPASFADLPSLFTALDANGDQWIERDELAKVQTVRPHLRLAVTFASTNEDDADPKAPKRAQVEVREAAAEVQPLDGGAADRALFALGETRVLISAHDMSEAPNPRPQPAPMQGAAAPVGVRLMVHDRGDAIFEALDANADGVLGEREVAGAAALLAARDASGDGRLTVDETPYQMIVAFLYGEAPGGPSYFAPPAPPRRADEAPPAAWFVAADLNGDGDVSRREFLGDAATFAKLDADGDGYIDASEGAPADADSPAPAGGP